MSTTSGFRRQPHVLSLWGPVAIYMAVIFYFSSLTQPPRPLGVEYTPAHAIGYLGLAVVVVRALVGGLPARVGWFRAALALMICVAYGATDEFHQTFVPGRTADVADLLTDSVGAAIGTALCWAWGIIAPASASPNSRHDL
jgi:VanZ family protein